MHYKTLLISLNLLSVCDTSDFNVPPVGNPRGTLTFILTGISFDVLSVIDFLLTAIDLITPLKIYKITCK